MKKLSIEEKAKAYDKALEYAMIYYKNGNEDMKMMMKTCFPVLVEESEDERIKEWLIALIRSNEYGSISDVGIMPCPKPRVLAWLEAQGEHANFRNKIQVGDKVTRNEDGVLVNLSQLNRVAKKDEKQGEKETNGNERKIPDSAWSEEDEDILDDIIIDVGILQEQDSTKGGKAEYQKEIDWLKSLKDRYAWKPSDEQMAALLVAVGDEKKLGSDVSKELYELYLQLKQL